MYVGQVPYKFLSIRCTTKKHNKHNITSDLYKIKTVVIYNQPAKIYYAVVILHVKVPKYVELPRNRNHHQPPKNSKKYEAIMIQLRALDTTLSGSVSIQIDTNTLTIQNTTTMTSSMDILIVQASIPITTTMASLMDMLIVQIQ
jgi:hypothetical protein